MERITPITECDHDNAYEHRNDCADCSHRYRVVGGSDSSLGVGHIWTEVACPAYRSFRPTECTCTELAR